MSCRVCGFMVLDFEIQSVGCRVLEFEIQRKKLRIEVSGESDSEKRRV